MISTGKKSVSLEDILNKVTESDILSYYLGVKEIPTFINSPLREDKRPSFGLYSSDGKRIYFTDMSTGDRGGLFDLLGKMWAMKYTQVLERIYKDIPNMTLGSTVLHISNVNNNLNNNWHTNSDLQVKIRDWKQWDIDYWGSYGITKEWLEYAEVYPVSHIFITKEGITSCYPADKLAYTYVERKEGKVTLKVYQPFNQCGHKWSNKHDRSVISLWTKVPEFGNKICVCSSMKDALCLWCNTGIPSIAIQGEGYNMSDTAIGELKRRYKKVYILFDNDRAGLYDGERLQSLTGFTNVVLPFFKGGKDVSDFYLSLKDKSLFIQTMQSLIK